MKICAASLFAMAALGALVAGCAQKRTQPVAQSASPKATAPVAAPAEEASAEKEKRPRFGESVVYVDGKPVGVIRATELPVGLKGRVVKLGEGYESTRYGFVDYVRALGVDKKRIKALHLYGGSRAVVVDQKELARIGDGITFSFTQGDRGKPRVHWPPVKLNVNSTIDMVTNVAVYVEKEPPVLVDRVLVMPDGSPIEGKVPYAPEEQGNGTRIYVDGTLVGTVKRKKITNDMLASQGRPDPDNANAKLAPANAKLEDQFSLLAYATKLQPAAQQAKSIDLVAGDDVVAHLSSEGARSLTFNVPARNRGQAVVDVPGAEGTRRARISALQIYVNSAPPTRAVVKLDDAPEAAIGSGQGGSGSDDEL
jgi:hypothetical protein